MNFLRQAIRLIALNIDKNKTIKRLAVEFDKAFEYLEKYPKIVVPVSQLGLNIHNPPVAGKVDKIVESIQEGHKMPLIQVYGGMKADETDIENFMHLDGSDIRLGEIIWFIEDGHHRAAAYARLDYKEIEAADASSDLLQPYIDYKISHSATKLIALTIDKNKLNTLWYENKDGDKHVPNLEGDMPPDIPEGYNYQVSQFPDSLRTTWLKITDAEEVAECPHLEEHVRPTYGWIDGVEGRECAWCGGTQTKNIDEEWPNEWEAYGSRELMSGNSGWSEDLVLAMANSGDYTLSEAIIVAATSCGRCMNVLYHEYGLDDGYPEFSDEWQKANTQCEFCTTEEEWQALMGEVNEEEAAFESEGI